MDGILRYKPTAAAYTLVSKANVYIATRWRFVQSYLQRDTEMIRARKTKPKEQFITLSY